MGLCGTRSLVAGRRGGRGCTLKLDQLWQDLRLKDCVVGSKVPVIRKLQSNSGQGGRRRVECRMGRMVRPSRRWRVVRTAADKTRTDIRDHTRCRYEVHPIGQRGENGDRRWPQLRGCCNTVHVEREAQGIRRTDSAESASGDNQTSPRSSPGSSRASTANETWSFTVDRCTERICTRSSRVSSPSWASIPTASEVTVFDTENTSRRMSAIPTALNETAAVGYHVHPFDAEPPTISDLAEPVERRL